MRNARATSWAAAVVGGALVLAGCGSASDHGPNHAAPSASASHSHPGSGSASPSASASSSEQASGHSGSGHMHHAADGGPAPAGMKKAEKPTYAVGSSVTLTADHMEGMKGAKAKIVGAYKTTVYAVDYTPTDGGAVVKDHRWVVHEELKDPGAKPLGDGSAITILADHMPGMKGAKGNVASSTSQTVYMVNYEAGGMTMKNHKWVVEDEIKPAK